MAQNSSAPGVTASENDAAEANTLHDELPCNHLQEPQTGKKTRRPSLERGVDCAEGLTSVKMARKSATGGTAATVRVGAEVGAEFLPKSCPNTPAPESIQRMLSHRRLNR